jgi:protein disulfide-isomerase A1
MKGIFFLFVIFISINCVSFKDFLSPKNYLKDTSISFPKLDGIIYLTDKTIEEAISTNKNLLLLVFAHWCPHCKKAYPKFSQAALSEEVKKYNNFAFASINGDHYHNILSKYGVSGFPTILYFSNYGREQTHYNGNTKSKDDFIEWIYRKEVNPLKEINSVDEIKKNYENKQEISYVYFGNVEKELNIIKNKAENDFDHIYGHVKDEEVMKKYGVKPSTIVMFTSHDEKIHFSEGIIDDNTINKLDSLHKYPYLISAYEGGRIFQYDKKPVVFVNLKDDDRKKYDKYFFEIAKKYRKNQLYFSLFDGEKYPSYVEYIGHPDSNFPKVAIIDIQYDDVQKWYLNGTFNENKMNKFVEDYVNGKFKASIKSEEIPKEQKEVFKVVGNSFMKEVIENDKDVLVKFYSPYCGHCKKLEPTYIELGKRFEKLKDYVRIAEFNMLENSLEYESINGYPTLLFYPKGKKNQKGIQYKGDRSLNDMTIFIITNAGNNITFDGNNVNINHQNKEKINEKKKKQKKKKKKKKKNKKKK